MLGIVYLTYQPGYSFTADNLFQRWMRQVDTQFHIDSITIVDNFDTQRKTEKQSWQNASVSIIAGDNRAREFSGYQKGLNLLQGDCSIILILNDTFLSSKHHPWNLLLPSVIKTCKKLQNREHDSVFGEVNRAPKGATFDGTPTTWISSYCLIFTKKQLTVIQAAIQNSLEAFDAGEIKFNKTFTQHIERQINGLPVAKDPANKRRKFQATAAEISLSKDIQLSGLRLQSIYAVSISPWLFIKYTAARTTRKLKFISKK